VDYSFFIMASIVMMLTEAEEQPGMTLAVFLNPIFACLLYFMYYVFHGRLFAISLMGSYL
jgi:hypothetical protein